MRPSIASLTPTVASLFGVAPPTLSDEPILASIAYTHRGTLQNAAIDRCLVYCPDALGDHLWNRFPEALARVCAHYPQRIQVRSVVPSMTPVCFTSIFTGTSPGRHPIRKPERPILTCDTLFDAQIRAGKRIAIVAVENSSIALMYRNRPIDYFPTPYDQEATEQALELFEQNRHDLVVVYHQEYDDQLHRTAPFSDECLRAFQNHVTSAELLAGAAHHAWSLHPHALIVAPDHGGHYDEMQKCGSHGLDIAEDMEVSHFYGLHAASGEIR